jgi:hypothetical protein
MLGPNRTLLEAAVRLLEPILEDLVSVGGCATGLFITDPAAEGIRPTKDVDVITEIASSGAYARLSERLRALGLREDTREGGRRAAGVTGIGSSTSCRRTRRSWDSAIGGTGPALDLGEGRR